MMRTSNEPLATPDQGSLHAVAKAQEQAFIHAQNAQRQRELGAAFAHRCLTALIWTGGALVLAILVIGGLAWQVANPPIKYFATQNGRVIPVVPKNTPGFSDSDVSAFGAESIRRSFTLTFGNYKNQINDAKDYYDDRGYEDYYKALNASNILPSIRDQRMDLNVDVGPGRLKASCVDKCDVVIWEYQYPVTLKLDGQVTGAPAQRFIFTERIQRTDVQVKNKGLEVVQIITTGAN